MNIVVEGIDGSGKTRLARLISNQVSLDYADRNVLGQGPPKDYLAIVERLKKYLDQTDVVFDRHTAVSQPIYGLMRDDAVLPEELIKQFYSQKPIIIYARCIEDGLKKHQVNLETESQEHLQSLHDNYDRLLAEYDRWAMKHALIWYTEYSQGRQISLMVQGAMGR